MHAGESPRQRQLAAPGTSNGVSSIRSTGDDEVDFIDPQRDLNRHRKVQERYPSASLAPSLDEPVGRTPVVGSINDGHGYLVHCGDLDTDDESVKYSDTSMAGYEHRPKIRHLDNGGFDDLSERSPLIGAGIVRKEPPKVTCSCGVRWSVSIFGFFIFFLLYALRFNLSVAVVDMAGNMTVLGDDNGTIVGPEFTWTKSQQGYLNSAFFYGYLAMSLPSGWVAGRFGAHRTITVGMFLNGVLCISIPLVARFSLDALIVIRVLQGLSQAVVFPAFHALLGKWAPRANVGLMAALGSSGCSFGVTIAFTAGSALGVDGFGRSPSFNYRGDDWPSIFYVFGGVSLLVTLVWYFMCYESPAVHPRISAEERAMIENDLAASRNTTLTDFSFLDVLPLVAFCPERIRRRTAVPWRSILLSRPVWVLTIALIAADFGNYTLLTCVPTFFHEVLLMPVENSGIFAALPYIGQWVLGLICGFLVNTPAWRDNVSYLATRRVFTTLNHIGTAAFIVGASYATDVTLALALVVAAGTCQSFNTTGAYINHIDLSPRFAGVLLAFTNFFGSIGGIVGPYLADALTPHKSAAEWRIVFFITAGIYTFAAIIYAIFSSADRQPWAEGEVFTEDVDDVDEYCSK